MKVLFALYDENDMFIDCGFSIKEIGINPNSSHSMQRNKGNKKLYRIPLEVQDDIFAEEDEAFIQEELLNVYSRRELAERWGINIRSVFRRIAKRRKNERV